MFKKLGLRQKNGFLIKKPCKPVFWNTKNKTFIELKTPKRIYQWVVISIKILSSLVQLLVDNTVFLYQKFDLGLRNSLLFVQMPARRPILKFFTNLVK